MLITGEFPKLDQYNKIYNLDPAWDWSPSLMYNCYKRPIRILLKLSWLLPPDGVNYHRKCKTPFMSRFWSGTRNKDRTWVPVSRGLQMWRQTQRGGARQTRESFTTVFTIELHYLSCDTNPSILFNVSQAFYDGSPTAIKPNPISSISSGALHSSQK